MTPEDRAMLQVVGLSIWKNLQLDVAIFLLYGIFAPLTIVTIQNLITYVFRYRPHPYLDDVAGVVVFHPMGPRLQVGVIAFSFLMATGAMISVFATNLGPLAVFTRGVLDIPLEDVINNMNNILVPWTACLDWFATLSPIIIDALTVWRAWTIFSDRRWAKYILVSMWSISVGTLLSGLILTSFITDNSTIDPSGNQSMLLNIANDIMDTFTGLSFATNFLATAFIAYILWGHLKLIKSLRVETGLQGKFQAWRVLMLLVDTGFVYCGLQLFNFIISLIPEDITSTFYENTMFFSNVYLMISAFYPTLVTYLIHGLSSAAGVHEAATAIYGSQQQDKAVDV